MVKKLRSRNHFSKSSLSVFLIVFAVIGLIILIKSFAAPNPNLPGDLNGDNTVNIQDLSILLSNYNTANTSADINNDGTVNVLDLSILLSHYGQSYSGGGGGGPWAWNATTATLDPNSANYINAFLSYGLVQPLLGLTQYQVAVADATTSDPTYTIPLTKQGGTITVRVPLGTKPDPQTDGHLTVRDSAAGTETDFWQAVYDSTSQKLTSASAAVKFLLGSVNEMTTGWGGDAANLPLRRGIVTPDEIKAGVINHPLVLGIVQVGSGSPRYPALHNASSCGANCTNRMVEGTWLRLNPSTNCSGYSLPSWQVTICVAMQKYGMFIRDTAGTLEIYGLNPINGGTTWASAGFSGYAANLSGNFPWSQLQVLNPPPP
jgi:hypothetical protein